MRLRTRSVALLALLVTTSLPASGLAQTEEPSAPPSAAPVASPSGSPDPVASSGPDSVVHSLAELLAPGEGAALETEEMEARYPAEWSETVTVGDQRTAKVLGTVTWSEYEPIGSAVRLCAGGSHLAPRAEQLLHRQTACYLAVLGEWLAYLEAEDPGTAEAAFGRARDAYTYVLAQLGERGSAWLTRALRARLPATADELAARQGAGKPGFRAMIRGATAKRMSPTALVRMVRDAVAADRTGIAAGSWQLAGSIVPDQRQLPEIVSVPVTLAGACVRDVQRATILPRADVSFAPYRSDACVELVAALWDLWRRSGVRDYKVAAERVWRYTRATVPGVNVEAVAREADPDRFLREDGA